MGQITISDAYPAARGYISGVVADCSTEKITLTNGKTYDFSFPEGGLRKRLTEGTNVVLKVPPRGSVREFYVLESDSIQRDTQDVVAGICTSPIISVADLNALGNMT